MSHNPSMNRNNINGIHIEGMHLMVSNAFFCIIIIETVNEIYVTE